MFSFIIAVVAISLILILAKAVLKFSKEVFTPDKQEVSFNVSDKHLIISSKMFSGMYEILIPNNISINKNDKVSLSYYYDRGYLTGIRELYVNDFLVADEEKIKKLNLKMLLNWFKEYLSLTVFDLKYKIKRNFYVPFLFIKIYFIVLIFL